MMTEMKPCVSVIMAAYNAESFAEKSIRSVQMQTVEDWELLVIDDCSSDGTAAVLEKLAREDPRIRVYRNQHNLGVAKTRNRGLGLCKGAYVAFLDCDDLWHPDKLEKQLACFRDTGAGITYTSYAIVDRDGKQCCPDFMVDSTVSFEGMLRKNQFGCSTVMVKADALQEKRFPEDFYHEDYVLWLQLLEDGCKAVGLKEILVDYFYHKDSKAGNKGNAALQRWKIYRDYLKFDTFKSMWYFAQYALAGALKYRRA